MGRRSLIWTLITASQSKRPTFRESEIPFIMSSPDQDKLSKLESGQSPSKDLTILEDEGEIVASTKAASTNGGWMKYALAAAAAGAVTVGISVPVARRNNDKSSSTSYEPPPPIFDPEENGLPLLSSQVLGGYNSTSDLKAAIELMATAYVNGTFYRNSGYEVYANFGMGDDVMMRGQVDIMEDSVATPGVAESGGDSVPDTTNDFETNNQEEGVSEGDTVVTDGVVAFGSFGEYLVAWRVSDGTELLRLAMDATDSWSTPYINTLLLHEKHLIVAVGGYGWDDQEAEPRVLSSFNNTRIKIYNYQSLLDSSYQAPVLTHVTSRDVHGDFVSIREIEGKIYMVMSSQLQLYRFLGQPFEQYGNPDLAALDIDSYADYVRQTSELETIPSFVDQLTEELLECGQIPNFVQMNRWTTDENSNPELEHYLYRQGVAESLVTIVSFDMAVVIQQGEGSLDCLSIAGSFFPTNAWDVKVYSATHTMIMAIQGYDYSAAREMSIDSTYMVAFDLSSATVAPKAFGKVDGYVLDQYSFRVDGNVLEMATTIREQWMWIAVEPMILDRRLQEGPIQDFPTTENYVMTMNLNGAEGEMELMDKIKLGKEGEVFTTVRFYEDLAYAVTFRQMDPFYVLDTSDPSNIVKIGELDNITGWSSYLEPIDDDNKVLLAIGQEANEWGGPLGLSISVFDATVPENVRLSARLIIESSNDVWSGSEGLQNKNAVRFNKETGRLILPMTLSGNNFYYRGFRVYDISTNAISEVINCRITMEDDWYYSYQSLPPRSMIINGDMMATMGNEVVSKDLGADLCTENWSLTL